MDIRPVPIRRISIDYSPRPDFGSGRTKEKAVTAWLQLGGPGFPNRSTQAKVEADAIDRLDYVGVCIGQVSKSLISGII